MQILRKISHAIKINVRNILYSNAMQRELHQPNLSIIILVFHLFNQSCNHVADKGKLFRLWVGLQPFQDASEKNITLETYRGDVFQPFSE